MDSSDYKVDWDRSLIKGRACVCVLVEGDSPFHISVRFTITA